MDNKLNTYLKRYTQECTVSDRSLYYKFCSGVVLRVSDHYSANSDGIFSIIVTNNNPEQYILVRRSTGESKILSYEEVKRFIKALSIVQNALIDTCQVLNKVKDKIEQEQNKPPVPEGHIALSDLTPGQVQQVRLWYKQKGKKI